MAFKRSDELSFPSMQEKFTINLNEPISIPLVFTKEDGMFHGFTPGIKIKDVVSFGIESCYKDLTIKIKTIILQKIKNKEQLPFFPNDDEIKNDFDNVILIKRITLRLNK